MTESEPQTARGLEELLYAVMAYGKGKGKGKGSKGGQYQYQWQPSPGGGKGDGKGAKGGKGKGGGAKGGTYFEGNCNHCGAYGHRLRDCRQKDAEMRQFRG